MKPYPLYKTREISTIKDIFAYPLAHTPDKDAFRVRQKPDQFAAISWKQFKQDVDNLGTALYAHGMKGRHIAVIGDNMYEWVLAYMTALCGDMVVVPLDKDLPPEQLAHLISFADAQAVVFAPRFQAAMEKIRPSIPDVNLFVGMRPLKSEWTASEGYFDLRDLLREGAKLRREGDTSYVNEVPDVAKMAALYYTSGTTDAPKGVMLSQENLIASFDGACQHLSFTEDDVMLSVLPLHHAYESNCGILAMLHTSTVVCFNENLKLLSSNLKLFSPTGLSAVPVLLETLLKQIMAGAAKSGKLKQLEKGMKVGGLLGKMGVNAHDKLFREVYEAVGGRLKKGFVGGAPMNPETLAKFAALGIQFRQGYGITECSPLVSVNREKFNKNDSTGPVLPTCEVRIQDGEIQVRGKNVMLGYYKDSRGTRLAFTEDGWFRTGDLGYIDDDGFLYVTGREKNLIILDTGENVSPEELEQLLNNSSLVLESVVREEDNQITAHIVPDHDYLAANGEDATQFALNKMVAQLNAKQPRYKQITQIVMHDQEFEKTTTKKILRDRVRS